MLDAKWLTEILKATHWQLWGLTAAAAIIYFGPSFGVADLALLPSWAKLVALVSMIIFGCLTVFQAAHALRGPLGRLKESMKQNRLAKKRVGWIDEQLNSLSQTELEILSYLFTQNTQHFTAQVDGERATTLLSKRLVVMAGSEGQAFSVLETPYKVQDPVWKRMQLQPERFTLNQLPDVQPWREPLW